VAGAASAASMSIVPSLRVIVIVISGVDFCAFDRSYTGFKKSFRVKNPA
jgi:hypothetical protein